jgi:hypothetical protein
MIHLPLFIFSSLKVHYFHEGVSRMWTSFFKCVGAVKNCDVLVYIVVVTESKYQSGRSWLSHCATSRKVAGSIPDAVIGISYWQHNPSSSDSAFNSPFERNEYQEYFLEGVGG